MAWIEVVVGESWAILHRPWEPRYLPPDCRVTGWLWYPAADNYVSFCSNDHRQGNPGVFDPIWDAIDSPVVNFESNAIGLDGKPVVFRFKRFDTREEAMKALEDAVARTGAVVESHP